MLGSLFLYGQENNDIDIKEFKSKLDTSTYLLIDVRTKTEYTKGYIKNAINISYLSDDFEKQIQQLDKEILVLLYCHSGNRSRKAMDLMNINGFKQVFNLVGGIVAWKENDNILISK
jgi:rhodanese-related sulfurtransferase|tara:strand:- start:1602 stop:1952 length:351 start_codon:yes stop_codon:yes gene_type:complete